MSDAKLLLGTFEVEGVPGVLFKIRLFQNHLPTFVAEFGYGFRERFVFGRGIPFPDLGNKLNGFFSQTRVIKISDGRLSSPTETVSLVENPGNRAVFPPLYTAPCALIGPYRRIGRQIDRNRSPGDYGRCDDSQNKNLFCLAHQKPPWLFEYPGCQYKNYRSVSQTRCADNDLLPIAH